MTFLLGVIFVGVLAVSFSILALVTRPTKHHKAVQKRLGRMALAGTAQASVAEQSQELLKQAANGRLAWLDRLLARFAFYFQACNCLSSRPTERPDSGKIAPIDTCTGRRPALLLPTSISASFYLCRLVSLVAGAAAPVMSLRIRRVAPVEGI